MTHRRGAIWTERMLLGLIVVSLAGTLNLLIAIHRRALTDRRVAISEASSVAKKAEPPPAISAASPIVAPVESPAPAQKAEVEPPPPPVEDPTKKAIAALTAAKAKEIEAAQAADERTGAMETAYQSAIAESGRWKRREMLVRQQIAGITADAQKLERDADALDAERDVLERELDATKAALAKASKRSGFAVLPYKGPNGTWRRPIVIECTRGAASLQPRGPKFTVLDLSPRIRPRSSNFVRAVARELDHIQSTNTPDGAPAVPYIVFLVRPDGVAPYYLARTCLEPLGIAFGYELVDQNLEINIPDFDDVTTWDGTVPLDLPLERAPVTSSNSGRLAQANQSLDQPRTGNTNLPRADQGSMIGAIDGAGGGNRQGGQGTASHGGSQPEDFVWPGRGVAAARNGGQASGALADPDGENGLAGGVSPAPSQDGGPAGKRTNGGELSSGALTGHFPEKGDHGGPGGDKERNGNAESGSGDLAGAGRSFASASGGRGFGDQPGRSSSGLTKGAVNAEDIGTAAGADPTGQPFAGSRGGTGGGAGEKLGSAGAGNELAGEGNGSGGGSSAPDSIFQLPNFEPAVDKPAGTASVGQPGLLSGRGSQGGSPAGVQAPAFGLGQSVTGSKTPGADLQAAGSDGASTGSGGAKPGGTGSPGLITSALGGSQATDGNPVAGDLVSGGGSNAQAADSNPVADGAAGSNKTAKTANGGIGAGQGPGRGFDWVEAAKDDPQAAASNAPAANSAQGGEASGTDTGPQSPAAAARANLAAGGALNRSNFPANVPPDLQAGAYQAGQYSQEDIERAKSLSGLSSLVSPGLAQKLAGAAAATGFTPSMPSSPESNSTTSSFQTGALSSSAASSDSSSNNQPGAVPLGSNSQSSSSSASVSSTNSFGLNTTPNTDEANELIMPPRPKPVLPSGAIEAPFQIVVVCRKDEVLLHPGSYRLTGDVLRTKVQGSDSMLAREIRAMVRNRAMVDPLIRQKPSLRFLVEAQGAETFALARRQLLFSLPDWPVSLQVSGSQDPGVFSRNPW